MKKLFTLLLLVAFTGFSFAQTEQAVTFQVDMSAPIDNGDFVAGTDTLSITGSVNGWIEPVAGPDYTLEDPDGNNIYTLTLNLFADSTYQFKFFKNSGWDGGEWDGDPNREYTVPAFDAVVSAEWGVEGLGLDNPVASEFKAYPNPSNGVIQIETPDRNSHVTVLNTIGKVMLSKTINKTGTINLSNYAKGIYLIRVDGYNEPLVKRVIIE